MTRALTVSIGEITTLNHELLNDPVESRSLVAEPFLAGTQLPEVLGSLRNCLSIKTNNDTTELLITVSDVEVNLSLNLSLLQVEASCSIPYLVGNLGSFGS